MKIKLKKIFLILVSLAFLYGAFLIYKTLKSDYIFSIQTLSSEEYEEIIKTRQENSLDIDITLNGETIAALSDNSYFVVQKNDDAYEGNLSIKENKYKLAIIKPEYSKLELIKNGEALKLLIYDNDNYEIRDIYLTYIPIVVINNSQYYEWADLGKDIYTAELNLYSYLNDEMYQKETYYIKHHVRGNLTLDSSKKSYGLDIIDEDGNKKDVSLLNMREDDDWNLLSMSMDASYMKEKLSMDIWEQISPYSIESRYVELIKDGNYKGLYLLCEPTDIKTLGGDSKEDILAKISNWYSEEYYGEAKSEHVYCLKDNKCVLDDITFKNLTYDPEDKEEMAVLADAFHRYFKESESDILEFDYDNCVEYSTFLQLTMATDNTYKNERMLVTRDGDKYKITKGAWDFDYSFRSDNIYKDFFDYILPLEYKDSDEYMKDCARLYESIKNYYNEDNLLDIINRYDEYLTNSGALTRLVKNNVYVESDNYDEALSTLKDVIKKRSAYVDTYYSNILKGE